MKLKYQIGGTLPLGGSSKSNQFLPKPIQKIPEINVNGIDRRLRFDRREADHKNGRKVISETFFDYYNGGNRYLGDLAPIRGGRTIYTSPKGNDTLYWNQPSTWIDYENGFMPVGGNQVGAKTNFFKNLKKPLIRTHQTGGQFKENLNPPSRGFLGEMKTNLQQGNEIFGRMVNSTPVQLLLTGITSGIGGMFGPTMKISKTAKELATNPRNAIRKFSRNLNARKGDPTYRWTKTSGNLREGGAHDYQFPGMGSRTRMKVNSAARSEGSGYSAQPTLNANPTYQRASAPAQTPMQRTWNHQRSVPVEWQASRRVMQRNNLIDQARDWRNYIFESPRFGGANFKVIPK